MSENIIAIIVLSWLAGAFTTLIILALTKGKNMKKKKESKYEALTPVEAEARIIALARKLKIKIITKEEVRNNDR